MTTAELIAAIQGGLFDDDLSRISAAANARGRAIAPTARDFKVGDKVRFNNTTRPKYMRGMTATVTGIRQTRITVTIAKDHGRYRAGATIVTPTTILEHI